MAASVVAKAENIFFVACHGGPADHMASFAKNLKLNGKSVSVISCEGVASDKFRAKQVEPDYCFTLTDVSTHEQKIEKAKEIVNYILALKIDAASSMVITDLGHEFDAYIQRQFQEQAPSITRACYYDNPENYVIGGYMNTAKEVLLLSQVAFFASVHVAKSPLYLTPSEEIVLNSDMKRIGVGYYAAESSLKVAIDRKNEEERSRHRKEFFEKMGLEDQGQKLWFYFGGNNPDYFQKAFPTFLTVLKQVKEHLPNDLFVLQAHPSALGQDAEQIQSEHPLLISKIATPSAQIIADGALYYQTSMSFPLCQIPTIQIAHEPFNDVHVKKGIVRSVCNGEMFLEARQALEEGSEVSQEEIMEALGYDPKWEEVLLHNLQLSQ